ncbi:MAG: DNA-binding protein WhiA [Defluviitaleaceae bacterium]|nr:DNA-binding protein WhiA [Defluviitaleaceae bacterium]
MNILKSHDIRAEIESGIETGKKMNRERSFVRECFIAGGVISNPSRTYHLEFTLEEPKADKLLDILTKKFGLRPKKIARKGQFVVYIKEGDEIADVLKIIRADKSLMIFESTRVEKSIRNEINRRVNFETANLNKTAIAAMEQLEAIEYIAKSVGLSYLSAPLEEVARLRIMSENLSLAEIGLKLYPPVSKSAVNHRLRKICKIAESLRGRDKID